MDSKSINSFSANVIYWFFNIFILFPWIRLLGKESRVLKSKDSSFCSGSSVDKTRIAVRLQLTNMETRLKDTSNLDINAQFSIFGTKKGIFLQSYFLLFWNKVSISAGGKDDCINWSIVVCWKIYLDFTFVNINSYTTRWYLINIKMVGMLLVGCMH